MVDPKILPQTFRSIALTRQINTAEFAAKNKLEHEDSTEQFE